MDLSDAARLAKFARPKRGDKLLIQRAFAALRDHQTLTARVLAGLLGCSRSTAANALDRLRIRGAAAHNGLAGWRSVYTYVPGSRAPRDMRGRTEGSREALRLGWRYTPASAANLRNHKPHPVAQPGIELERCWAWPTPSASPLVDED